MLQLLHYAAGLLSLGQVGGDELSISLENTEETKRKQSITDRACKCGAGREMLQGGQHLPSIREYMHDIESAKEIKEYFN